MTTQSPPRCPYCHQLSERTTGAEIYKSRKDLANLTFYACRHCEAYVGCHKAGAYVVNRDGTRTYSDGTLPLGRLANKHLRRAKQDTHAALDPLWQEHPEGKRERTRVYRWLAKEMGIHPLDCHIGAFDIEQCRQAIRICEKRSKSLQPG